MAKVVGAINTLSAELKAEMQAFRATLSDNTEIVGKQNGRIRTLEERGWKLDASLSVLGKVGVLFLGALGTGVAIAKLFL